VSVEKEIEQLYIRQSQVTGRYTTAKARRKAWLALGMALRGLLEAYAENPDIVAQQVERLNEILSENDDRYKKLSELEEKAQSELMQIETMLRVRREP